MLAYSIKNDRQGVGVEPFIGLFLLLNKMSPKWMKAV